MIIGVPREIIPGERRVALVPETVSSLVKAGHVVLMENGAGEGAYFSNRAYEEAGATLVAGPAQLCGQAEAVLKVQRPAQNEKLNQHEADLLREHGIFIAFLQPHAHLDLVRKLMERKITSFSMEAVPRITRAQKMDALSSMSTVAGYKAVLLAADRVPKFFPMLMTAAGTIVPAKVFIIGAGVAGLQAIATARRLGAVVEAFDTRPAVKEQVESLGARFVEMEWTLDRAQAEDAGGYAKELSEEFYRKEKELIARKVGEADVVVTTALIPGKPAPVLITEEMVKSMRPGSVIVDLAAEMGGNCALTRSGQEVFQHGVTILGTLNLPSLLPFHASQMYSRNISSFFLHLLKEGKLHLDWSDEITQAACVTHDGEIRNEGLKSAVLGKSVTSR